MSTKSVQLYNVKGHFKDKGEIVKFSRIIRSMSEADAKEKIFLHFGSKHKIKRQAIKFDSVSATKDEDSKENEAFSSSEGFKYFKG